MNGPAMFDKGPLKLVAPSGRVAIADRSEKYYPLRVGHEPSDAFVTITFSEGKVVEQKRDDQLTAMMHRYAGLAAEPELKDDGDGWEETWRIDLDHGCQRWRGWKSTRELRRALRGMGFTAFEIIVLLHEARGGKNCPDDYWETETPFEWEVNRVDFGLPDAFEPELEFELVFGMINQPLEEEPGDETWRAVRTVAPHRYHILNGIDMWEATGDEDQPQYVIELQEVDVAEILKHEPNAIAKLGVPEYVAGYADTPDEKFLAVDFAQYGQHAPLWSMSGNDWGELVHEAKYRSARLCSEYEEWYRAMYDTPVNRMGSTAHDFMLGRLTFRR